MALGRVPSAVGRRRARRRLVRRARRRLPRLRAPRRRRHPAHRRAAEHVVDGVPPGQDAAPDRPPALLPLVPTRGAHPGASLLPLSRSPRREHADVLASLLQYGVDHSTYMSTLAKDMGAAPSLWQLLREHGLFITLVYCFSASFTSHYRLIGPFRSTKAPEVVRTEIWDTVQRRGLIVRPSPPPCALSLRRAVELTRFFVRRAISSWASSRWPSTPSSTCVQSPSRPSSCSAELTLGFPPSQLTALLLETVWVAAGRPDVLGAYKRLTGRQLVDMDHAAPEPREKKRRAVPVEERLRN